MMAKKKANTGSREIVWMDADQAAAHLCMTRQALYHAKRRGLIPFYKHGKRLLFRRDELDALPKKGFDLAFNNDDLD